MVTNYLYIVEWTHSNYEHSAHTHRKSVVHTAHSMNDVNGFIDIQYSKFQIHKSDAKKNERIQHNLSQTGVKIHWKKARKLSEKTGVSLFVAITHHQINIQYTQIIRPSQKHQIYQLSYFKDISSNSMWCLLCMHPFYAAASKLLNKILQLYLCIRAHTKYVKLVFTIYSRFYMIKSLNCIHPITSHKYYLYSYKICTLKATI